MTTLYGRANAWNVRKVMFLIEDIGLRLERLDYGRGFTPTSTPDFLAMNPNGMVPVLKDGGTVIWESHTILRYLASKYAPDSYYPRAFDERARVDQWMDWQLAHIPQAILPLFFQHVLKSVSHDEQTLQNSEEACAKLFTILDSQLAKTGAFATGPDLTIADCALGVSVHRWLGMPIKRPCLNHVSRYYAALSERPSFQKAVNIGTP